MPPRCALVILNEVKNQVISNTRFESPCSTKEERYRFSPLWSNGPRLHGGNPIGFVTASRGGVYIESKCSGQLQRRDSSLSLRMTDKNVSVSTPR